MRISSTLTDLTHAQDPAPSSLSGDEDGADTSDSDGEEDAPVDDVDLLPEAKFRRVENFDMLLKVFRFINSCNNGRGLTNESTVWLSNLLREERLRLELIRHWRTLHAVMQYGMSLLMTRRVYGTHSVTVPGWPSAFECLLLMLHVSHTFSHSFFCATSLDTQAVLELLGNPANAEGFMLFLRTETSGAGHVYTTPESAIFWEEAQKAAEEQFGPGAVVVPLIISSDATNLSDNKRTKVWAVYVSLANIPLRRRWLDYAKILLALLPFPPTRMTPTEKSALFQAAMKVVLADLIVASHT
ncbi:unnamed protein product [Closterium sp. NIES-53]